MIKKIFLNSSFFLIVFFALVLIVSNVAFIFGFHLSFFNSIISFFITVFLLGFVIRNTVDVISSVFFAIIVSIASYYLAINYFDTSWDGQGYHQETIYLLKNGWNPISSESNAFHQWIDVYQKGNEIIQANIYLITNKIEAGKLLNIILVYIAFFVFWSFLDTLKLKKSYRFFLCFVAVFNPVVFTQVFTYYIDGNWYLTLLVSLASLLTYFSNKKLPYLIIFVLSSVTFCSLKFSSIPIFMVFAIIAVIYHFIDQKKIMIAPFFYILVLSFFCNVNPFMTNILNGNNVLHPFAGDKKIDIINQNIPKLLLNKNRVERTAISLFSKTNNDFRHASFPEILKIPFTFSKDELFINFDTRLGGFGFLFSGVLVITVLVFFFIFFKKNEVDKTKIALVLSAILISVLINPASWWSRLSAQIWLFPIVLIIFGLISHKKVMVILSQITIIILMINILISGGIAVLKLHKDNKEVSNFVNSVGNKTIVLDLSNRFGFKQCFLKFKERNIKYKIEKIKDKKKVVPFTPDVYYRIE